MNGPQDVGGMMGFGPIAPETDEPIFHAPWERRALGLVLTTNAFGNWNLDISRHTRENRTPSDYYGSSYYEIWIKAAETLLERNGILAGTPPRRSSPRAAEWPAILASGSPYNRPVDAAPRFAPGDRVRMKNINPKGHTRLPRYVRGKVGTIESEHGGFVFPDTNAHGQGEQPQRLYTVVFAASELWGEVANPADTVSVDAFESYLDAA